MFFDRQRLGDEHAVFVLELLLQASQGDGLPTADHAAQGNQGPSRMALLMSVMSCRWCWVS